MMHASSGSPKTRVDGSMVEEVMAMTGVAKKEQEGVMSLIQRKHKSALLSFNLLSYMHSKSRGQFACSLRAQVEGKGVDVCHPRRARCQVGVLSSLPYNVFSIKG